MGNQGSTEEHLEFKNVVVDYEFEKKLSDQRFGEIKLLKEKNTKLKIFQKDFSSNSKKEFDSYVEEVKKRTQLSHPNVLRILGQNTKKEDLFCTDYYKVSLFFESFNYDLEQEIFKRAKKNEYFAEADLWCIFDSVISACAFLQENQMFHGDIRPFNVFIMNNGDYKITDTRLFRQNFNPAYFGLLEGLDAKAHYPSPQVFEGLKDTDRNKPDNFDLVKNDVFALGLTILEAAHLKKPNVYDYEEYTVNSDKIEEALAKMKDRYSDTLIQTLRFTLNFSETERPDFLTLD